jgi:hypothetical protein
MGISPGRRIKRLEDIRVNGVVFRLLLAVP